MKCSQVSELIPDYLLGESDETAKSELRLHISSCALCREELESLEFIWKKLDALPDERAGAAVQDRFFAMLEGYKQGLSAEKSRPPWVTRMALWAQRRFAVGLVLQFGLPLVFLMIGLGCGYLLSTGERNIAEVAELRKELHDMRQLVVLSLLQQQSASERLEGVVWSSRVGRPDDRVISALLNALNHDPNINVRLAAVDALSQFSTRAAVRKGLIEALVRQNSPLVQIALIDALVQIQERQSFETLRQMAKDESLNQEVRQRAEWGLRELS